MNSILPIEFCPLIWKRVLYVIFSWCPPPPPWFSLQSCFSLRASAVDVMLWFGPRNWSFWPKTKSQPGAFRGRRKGHCAQSDSARCQLSSLMWVSPCKWQMGVFSANVHLSKTLTSDAQAFLLNNEISGSCPSAQLWALSLSTGFHSIQEQGYGDPHASPSGYPMTLSYSAGLLLQWTPSSVCFLPSEIPRWRVNNIPRFLEPPKF